MKSLEIDCDRTAPSPVSHKIFKRLSALNSKLTFLHTEKLLRLLHTPHNPFHNDFYGTLVRSSDFLFVRTALSPSSFRHLELLPGQSYPIMVQRDFKITNAALGEELADENGRSVVRITHQPVNPRDLADDSDSDSDDFSFDDEDDEEEEEIDMEKLKAAINGKNGKKGKKAEEEDEEEDEDEEDDEDFEEPTATAIACSLIPGKIEQASLNLTFVADEVVMFEVTGKK